ncbi:MAG: GGDEF domain-containing protein [Acidimicrobiales bacterium]
MESLETLGALIAAAWANRTDHLVLSRRATQMQHEATHDGLTGLPNRILLQTELEKAIERHVRGLTLLFLDLDGFKAINDSYGHDAGDQALISIADRLSGLVGASGRVARLGGDEFVVLAGGRDKQALEVLARSIIAAVREPIDVGPAVVQVGTSIGIAVWSDGESSQSLMRRADEAMYEAKQLGKPTGTSIHRFSSGAANANVATKR